MSEFWLSFRLLLLLAVANVSPIVAKRLVDPHWAVPLDGGLRFFDGRPLFGPSKTIRGALAAIVTTALAAPVLGLPIGLGALIGAAAIVGDALASFIKRRLGITTSGRAIGLDQIPESLLPLLVVRGQLDLSWIEILGVTAAFFALEIPLARLTYRLGIRDQPY
jgi:CDP-2,3-bis-(O-geranylgeranyl)-sn-glycerol synthase